MKKTITNGVMLLTIAVFTRQMTQAQGTTYLSGLEQTTIGGDNVGNDSWLAASLLTGHNANGYLLNSVQLAMADASGNPSGFTVMIYANGNPTGTGAFPGSSLGALNGSANPSTTGIYTYTAANITLLPNSFYFIVVTAATAVANGAYEWNQSASPPSSNGGWGGGGTYLSSDGSSWSPFSGTYGQFSVTATAVPEPSSVVLLLMGGGALAYVRRRFNR
jgi:PEP-CTERM motif